MRKVLGVVLGVVVAMLTIMLVEFVGHQVFPPPAGASMTSPDAMAAYIADMPTGASLFVVAAWFLGALLGGWAAIAVGHWSPAAWIIGALIAIGGIYNATQIPAPLWMQLATVLAPALGALAAHHAARARWSARAAPAPTVE